jgi:hypothetical protein
MYVSSESPKIQNSQFLFVFLSILLLEWMAFGYGLQGWLESVYPGPGIIISLFALVVWGVLITKIEHANQLPPRIE